MEKQKIASKSYDVEQGSVTFAFADGTERTLRLANLPADVRGILALHGLIQKLGDSYAGALEAVESGEAADPVEWAVAQFDRVAGNLSGGIWATRESGPSQLARAIAEATGADVGAIQTTLKGWEAEMDAGKAKGASPAAVEAGKRAKAKIAGARKNPKVQEILARFAKEALARKMARLQGVDSSAEGLDEFLK